MREFNGGGSRLGTLDDKIELNRRMNPTLEAMARTLFKSWFVDFDPVRAIAEGRQPLGLSPELAALFPDSLQGSELRRIPKGWRVAPPADICDKPQYGYTASAPGEPGAERLSYQGVVLAERLRRAPARLNPNLSTEALEEAFRKVTRRMLVEGVDVEYLADGRVVHDSARLLNFDHPEHNDWLVVNQFMAAIDWAVCQSVRAHLRIMVERVLRKYGYPPDKQEEAAKTVLKQAELLCADWAV